MRSHRVIRLGGSAHGRTNAFPAPAPAPGLTNSLNSFKPVGIDILEARLCSNVLPCFSTPPLHHRPPATAVAVVNTAVHPSTLFDPPNVPETNIAEPESCNTHASDPQKRIYRRFLWAPPSARVFCIVESRLLHLPAASFEGAAPNTEHTLGYDVLQPTG